MTDYFFATSGSPGYALGDASLSSILSNAFVPLMDWSDSNTNHFRVAD